MRIMTNRNLRRKTYTMHREEYRKNWCMVHEDKRYSTKREQKEKMLLRAAEREMS